MATNADDAFVWHKGTGDTNVLPPAIAALQPMDVQYYSPGVLKRSYVKTEFSIVRINMFGYHRTGGRDTPFFGLEVVCGTNAGSYTPHQIVGVYGGQVFGGNYDNFEKMTNWVFEIY